MPKCYGRHCDQDNEATALLRFGFPELFKSTQAVLVCEVCAQRMVTDMLTKLDLSSFVIEAFAIDRCRPEYIEDLQANAANIVGLTEEELISMLKART